MPQRNQIVQLAPASTVFNPTWTLSLPFTCVRSLQKLCFRRHQPRPLMTSVPGLNERPENYGLCPSSERP